MEPVVGQKYTFGAGAFEWVPFASGVWGWKSPDGRQFDSVGNPLQEGQPAPTQAQPGATAPGAGLSAQQNQANALLDFLGKTPPNKINTYNFNKAKKSVQELTLAGYEALGRDKGDVYEEVQSLLPKHAAGPARGYVASLGGR